MAEATGDALEWAMALAKSPAERVLLRQRSLPTGMERLLQVAAGASSDTLAEFAAQTGESEPDIIEAARFYAREILFYQGSDAYRVLGVAHEADADTIRSHHRLLQQWLHPDRHSSDWDAIFASRVNAAWSRLRSDERRQAYDQANPPQHREDIAQGIGSPAWLTPQVEAGADDPDRWRRRAPVLVLFAVCGVLALLAIRDMQKEPAGVLGDVTAVQPSAADDLANGSVALHVPDPPAAEMGARVDKPRVRSKPAAQVAVVEPSSRPMVAVIRSKPIVEVVPSQRVSKPIVIAGAAKPVTTALAAAAKPLPKPIAAAAVTKPLPKIIATAVAVKPVTTTIAVAAKPLPKPVAVALAIKPAPKPVAIAVATKPAPKPVAVAVASKPAAKPVAIAVATKPAPKPVAIALASKPAAKPVAIAVAAKPAPKPVAIAVAAKPAPKPVAIAVATKPAPKPVAIAVAAKTSPKAVAVALATKPAVLAPVARTAQSAGTAKPISKTVAVTAAAKPPKPVGTPVPAKPSPIPVPFPVKPIAIAAATVAVPLKEAPAASSAATEKPLVSSNNKPPSVDRDAPAMSEQRMQQVQRVGGQLIAYMSKSGASLPPIWSSLSAQRGAAQLRDELQASGKLKVDSPNWRVSDNLASLRANVRYQDGRVGRLSANLVWRDQRWLISGLSVERDL